MALTELMDLYPTICDLVGVSTPETVQGKSLRAVLADPAASVREAAFSVSAGKGHFVRTADWAYMRYRDDTEELYDMKLDPGQFTNLASDPKRAQEKEKLFEILQRKKATAVK